MDILFAPARLPFAAPLLAVGLLIMGYIILKHLNEDYDKFVAWFGHALVKLRKTSPNPKTFASTNFDEFDRFIGAQRVGEDSDLSNLRRRWHEFKEHTSIIDDADRSNGIHNSIEPKRFFNPNEPSIEPKYSGITYGAIPGYFVSFGLLMTFYSLAAVLSGLRLDEGNFDIGNALAPAAFKFIISICGLFCSIVLSIRYRIKHNELAEIIEKFCQEIEVRFIFDRSKDRELLEALHEIKASVDDQTEELKQELKESIGDAFEEITDTMDSIAATIEKLGSNFSNIAGTLTACDEMLRRNAVAASEAFAEAIGSFIDKSRELIKIQEEASSGMHDEYNDIVGKLNEFKRLLEENIMAAQSAFADATDTFIDGHKRYDDQIERLLNLEQLLEQLPASIAASLASGLEGPLGGDFRKLNQNLDGILRQVTFAREALELINSNNADMPSKETIDELSGSISELALSAKSTQTGLLKALEKLKDGKKKSNKQRATKKPVLSQNTKGRPLNDGVGGEEE